MLFCLKSRLTTAGAAAAAAANREKKLQRFILLHNSSAQLAIYNLYNIHSRYKYTHSVRFIYYDYLYVYVCMEYTHVVRES